MDDIISVHVAVYAAAQRRTTTSRGLERLCIGEKKPFSSHFSNCCFSVKPYVMSQRAHLSASNYRMPTAAKVRAPSNISHISPASKWKRASFLFLILFVFVFFFFFYISSQVDNLANSQPLSHYQWKAGGAHQCREWARAVQLQEEGWIIVLWHFSSSRQVENSARAQHWSPRPAKAFVPR